MQDHSTPPSSAATSSIRSVQPLKLPIGISHFADLIRGRYTFIDKTPMIQEVIERGAQVTLITRPRRFGKTLNLSMLQHFFSSMVVGAPTQGLFDGLAISGRPASMAHQGRYPVIFFTFKNIQADSIATFETVFRGLLADLYQQYPELPGSPALNPSRRKQVQALLDRELSLAEMANAFRLLSELLSNHHGEKVVILLDEYDAPLHDAYANGFYPQLIGFMRSLLGAALKDNPYLFKSVLTGILRVSRESLFSGLNNIKVHTVLDEGYGACFGFTEAEVSALLQQTGFAAQQPALEGQIKDWYNGYRFGRETIYNPWSIVSCLDEKGRLQPWWVNTSGHTLLKQLIAEADPRFKQQMELLLQRQSVEQLIDPNLVFGDLKNNSTALWSLLLFSGYLTATAVQTGEVAMRCQLVIPNREVSYAYKGMVSQWFTDRIGLQDYEDLLKNLAGGRVAPFTRTLQRYLRGSASYFDVAGDQPERFYHGFVLGLIAGLQDTHVIYSNRESGEGRYDVALLPRAQSSEQHPGILMEFKQADDPARLDDAAEQALQQIRAGGYRAQLEQHRIAHVLALGLAFSGKQVAVRSAVGI